MALGALLQSCGDSGVTLTVVNDSDIDRNSEIVDIDTAAMNGMCSQAFRITDAEGAEVPYQLTYDGKLIFPASVAAHSSARYKITAGASASAPDTLVCGDYYPQRKDDVAWENERSAYRAYGPALEESGEHAYGYDIWTKSVTHPIVSQRYYNDLECGISFHKDHGDGMDVYAVGPTLGGGTAALIDSLGNIVYPYCYSRYEILDNGPLRFTVRLDYNSGETRLISLDSGEFLNKTTVSFANADSGYDIAPGIVVHRQNSDGYVFMPDEGIMAYSDLTEDADADNGIIFVGVVAPEAENLEYAPLDQPAGDAVAHLLARSRYTTSASYTYYWGSGWSKGSMPDCRSWCDYLTTFRARIDNPLKVEVE